MDLNTVLLSSLVIFFGALAVACIVTLIKLPRMTRDLHKMLAEDTLPV